MRLAEGDVIVMPLSCSGDFEKSGTSSVCRTVPMPPPFISLAATRSW
jgi:hypothetical protein